MARNRYLMWGGRHPGERGRRDRRTLLDVGGAEHRNLGPGDWKSELFESWQLQSFCVEPAERTSVVLVIEKSLRMVSSI